VSARFDTDLLFAVVGRELDTVVRTRVFVLLALAFAAVVVGLAWAGGGAAGGYAPVTLDLLLPVEVLVPLLAFAFGYRAILGDAQRGELEMLRTYPLSRLTLVSGVYVGRAVALLVAVLAPLVLVGLLVPFLHTSAASFLPSHADANSAVVYLRFLVLTALFSLVVLAVALAISAAARSTREALVLVVVVFVALAVGFDLALVAALAGDLLPQGALTWLLAASPASAFRGLVFTLAVNIPTTGGVQVASPLASLGGLLVWLVGAFLLSVRSVWDAA